VLLFRTIAAFTASFTFAIADLFILLACLLT